MIKSLAAGNWLLMSILSTNKYRQYNGHDIVLTHRCRILGGVEILQNRGKSVRPADYIRLAALEQPPRIQTC